MPYFMSPRAEEIINKTRGRIGLVFPLIKLEIGILLILFWNPMNPWTFYWFWVFSFSLRFWARSAAMKRPQWILLLMLTMHQQVGTPKQRIQLNSTMLTPQEHLMHMNQCEIFRNCHFDKHLGGFTFSRTKYWKMEKRRGDFLPK